MRVGNVVRMVGAVLVPASLAAQTADVATLRHDTVPTAPKATISYVEARPLLDSLADDRPAELLGRSTVELESAWPDWVAQRDKAIRARVARGDEDSLVNLWLFGTSFTALPPARPVQVAAYGAGLTLGEVTTARLEDLLDGVASAGSNERLQFARQFLADRGMDPTAPAGKARARQFLGDTRTRMVAEDQSYRRILEAATAAKDPFEQAASYASLYRDRGLSSDTSILSSFLIDAALKALQRAGLLGARPVRRVALIGPGLDVLNKADGHDFYPEQTIQPLMLMDSLIRLGLSQADDLFVATMDISARVNQHLVNARYRAQDGNGYVLQLPLSRTERWHSALLSYWRHAGDRIGDEVRPLAVPARAGPVNVRAVRVRPGIVRAVTPHDLNIVLERLELADEERFDLVIATNVFAYYGTFEQSLAMTNAAAMVRPGGSLLSNQAVRPVAAMKPEVGHAEIVYSERQYDRVFWYQRQ